MKKGILKKVQIYTQEIKEIEEKEISNHSLSDEIYSVISNSGFHSRVQSVASDFDNESFLTLDEARGPQIRVKENQSVKEKKNSVKVN